MPSADRTTLAPGSGRSGPAPAFGAISTQLCFGPDKGLPGQAWRQGPPIVLRQLEGSSFKRSKAAHAVGLTCANAGPETWVLAYLSGLGKLPLGASEQPIQRGASRIGQTMASGSPSSTTVAVPSPANWAYRPLKPAYGCCWRCRCCGPASCWR